MNNYFRRSILYFCRIAHLTLLANELFLYQPPLIVFVYCVLIRLFLLPHRPLFFLDWDRASFLLASLLVIRAIFLRWFFLVVFFWRLFNVPIPYFFNSFQTHIDFICIMYNWIRPFIIDNSPANRFETARHRRISGFPAVFCMLLAPFQTR